MRQTNPNRSFAYQMEASIVRNRQPSRKAKRRRKHLYSEGQRNKLIDAIMDPLTKQDDFFVLIDGVRHFLNAGDPWGESGQVREIWSAPSC